MPLFQTECLQILGDAFVGSFNVQCICQWRGVSGLQCVVEQNREGPTLAKRLQFGNEQPSMETNSINSAAAAKNG